MEIVSCGGQTYFVPASDHEVGGIGNFNKWEQAFHVFSDVYTRQYPHRAFELIQYNQVIFSAAQNFAWENVYHYDKEFRLHLSNYPQCSWLVILQQAWTLCMKDRLCSENVIGKGGGHKTKKEACKRFNRGQCTVGLSCKYDH